MIKISGLPVEVTKADLDEIFAPYGTIQETEDSIVIEVGDSESVAYVSLDKNESEAVKELSNTLWRKQYLLYLDLDRGPVKRGQSKSGGNKVPKKSDKKK